MNSLILLLKTNLHHDPFSQTSSRPLLWTGNHGALTMRFRYGSDPLLLFSTFLYLLNRFVLKPHFALSFLHDHLNDLLVIPCALPWVLLLQRKLHLREHDHPPTLLEVLFHLGIWGIIFEGVAPHLIQSTGDRYDLLAYSVGALIAWAFWNQFYNRQSD